MKDLDYCGLEPVESTTTWDGYLLEMYEQQNNPGYGFLLREEQYGEPVAETTVHGEVDAQQILEAAEETPMKEVLTE